jgi:hypothetical protein
MNILPPASSAVLTLCPWFDRLAALHRALRQPQEILSPPPEGVALLELAEVWRAWVGVFVGDTDPVGQAAGYWSTRFSDRSGYAEALAAMLRGVDNSIGDRLADGDRHPDLVRTGDFPAIKVIRSPGQSLQGEPVPLAVGLPAGLDAGHPYHELARAGGYVYDGQPGLVLGPCHRNLGPRLWYWAPAAVRLTAALKAHQEHQAAEAAEADRVARLNERRRLELTPEVQLRRQLQRLQKLEAEGLIPAEPPPAEPAVRVAQPADRPARQEVNRDR